MGLIYYHALGGAPSRPLQNTLWRELHEPEQCARGVLLSRVVQLRSVSRPRHDAAPRECDVLMPSYDVLLLSST